MFIAVSLVTGEESVGPTSLYSFTTGYCYKVVSHKVSHATATFLGAKQQVYADNPHTHWMNLSKALMKQLHVPRSVNCN
jgi:hypothetical protein